MNYDRRFSGTRLRLMKRSVILQALANGLHVSEIAAEHRVCRVSLGMKLRKIMVSMGVRSRCEAVAMAFRKGWIQ